jgi:hypothetical protein
MLQINIYQRAKVFINTRKPGVIIVTFLILFFCASNGRAQVLARLQNTFDNYQTNNLQEKIYVHTNKTFYVAGEIIWFKIYCVNGNSYKMSDLSKVAYVDILDNNHVAVMQCKIALSKGSGSGSLIIPVSLTNGHYLLRAYTNWMKNLGADYFFERDITILNTLKAPQVQVEAVQPAPNVQFFPEGGHLVNGLTSKVAFKITGADGMGLTGTGAIVNKQNDTVARFKTLLFGMGSFTFTPSASDVYKAVINVNNKLTIKDLPEVSQSGYVIQAAANEEGWIVEVKNTDDKAASKVYLLIHNKHSVEIALEATLANGSTKFSISKNKLNDGLSYITMFDEKQQPLCERLIFKMPVKKLLLKAQTDGQTYNTRKKVEIAIRAEDQEHKPVASNLSVSVYRADTLQKEGDSHISSYLWLGSELKGRIESPDYYLENKDKETDQAIDNLMLSQGWTQFDWNKILTGHTPGFKFIPEYTGHIITGQITHNTTRAAVKNVMAYLSVPGTRQQLYVSKSDSLGRLLFNTRDLYGSSEIIVQLNTQIDTSYHVDIASPFSLQYSSTRLPPFTLAPYMEDAITANSFNMQVQNVFKGDQLKQFYTPQIDSLPFYGKAARSYLLDDYTRFTTMEEVLREYVTSIAISKRQGKFNIEIFKDVKLLAGKPIVLLDGTPIFDVDKIFSADPLKIRKLDVVAANYLYGPAVFNGVMSFTTYKGDMNGMELDPRAIILDYDGLQLERKFYSPSYGSDEQYNYPAPDFRSVLYWSPEAGTDVSGKRNITFYTSDKPGRYIGVIEGSTENGETGSRYFSFEVKK